MKRQDFSGEPEVIGMDDIWTRGGDVKLVENKSDPELCVKHHWGPLPRYKSRHKYRYKYEFKSKHKYK